MARLATLTLVTSLLVPSLAAAQPFQAPPPDPPVIDESTETWIAPNGNTLRAGQTQIGFHEFIYGDVAYGVTDWLEISAGVPVIPLIGQVSARLSLTSRESPLRIVVGGTAFWSAVDDGNDDYDNDDDDGASWLAVMGTVTVAYRTERFNLHVTGAFAPPDSGSGDNTNDAFGITNVGLTLKLGERTSAVVEMVELQHGEREHAERERLTAFGLKFLRPSGSLDFGFAYIHEDGGGILPLVSVTQRY